MKTVLLMALLLFANGIALAQAGDNAKKIFDTEKAFEKTVAEKGINAGFIEFLAPDGVIFNPEAANGREAWKKRALSPALLTWNPIWIEVSSNGALAYSIGNAIYRPKGKDDANLGYNHYLSIWSRQPNGEYRAVMDGGISHDKPSSMPTAWRSPTVSGNTKLLNSAGDHAVNFYATAGEQGAAKAYKAFLAEDAFLLREGSQPFVGKKAALEYLESKKQLIKFAKRKTFIDAGDLAWVYAPYSAVDRSGAELERGTFIQVWKLRDAKWVIAADLLVPITTAK